MSQLCLDTGERLVWGYEYPINTLRIVPSRRNGVYRVASIWYEHEKWCWTVPVPDSRQGYGGTTEGPDEAYELLEHHVALVHFGGRLPQSYLDENPWPREGIEHVVRDDLVLAEEKEAGP